MDSDEQARRERARARAGWPIRRHRLDEDVDDDLSATSTAEERIRMVHRLTLDAWASAGRSTPTYERSEAPGRVLRREEEGDS